MSTIIQAEHISRFFSQSIKEPGFKGSMTYLFHRKSYDIHAVRNISFTIQEGEIVGFIGANGAGKTTTLKMLSGILHPSTGNISVLGFTPADRNYTFLKQISLVMGQKNQLNWDLSFADSVAFYKELYEIPDAAYKEILNELIHILGLEKLLKIQIRKLSLGQRMKCELAASLIYNPKVLFLDEPTIGLDVAVQKNIRDFLKVYNQKYHTTIMLTSHYMDDIEALCHRVIIIDKGSLVYDGDLRSLIDSFVKEKNVNIAFADEKTAHVANLPGRIIKQDETSITIAIPRENHLDVIASLLANFQIKDISITDPSLEEIVRNIFATENSYPPLLV